MHRRTSTALQLALSLATLLATLASAPAHAQLTYTFLNYGDRGTPASGATNYLVNWPISYEECVADQEISIVITNAPYDATGMTRLVWDLWQGGTGTAGANCQTATSRRTTGTGGEAVCNHRSAWAGGGQITQTMPTLTFRPEELFPAGCDSATQGTFVFYVLAMNATGDTTTDIAATHYFQFSVALDFEAPPASTLEDAAGDRQITVEWTNTATETLAGARVYVDTAGTCGGTTSLMAGAAAPAALTPTEVLGSAPTSLSLDGEDLGLEIGDSVPIAVAVFDTARNESVLSNVACLERVPVSGFWDDYCREQMLDADECSARYSGCAAHPGSPGRPGALLLSLLALGAFFVRRRAVGGRR